jgi:hypothetical protein
MTLTNLLFGLLGVSLVCVGVFGKNLKFYEYQHHWFRSNRTIPNWQGRLGCIGIGVLFVVGAILARH